jgi:ferredoxin-NADP reductase
MSAAHVKTGIVSPTRDPADLIDVAVVTIKDETVDVRSFLLEATDRTPLPAYQPGAHIDVNLRPDLVRQYSLCGDPADRLRYMIAVKLEPHSRGGSRHMHESIRVGDRIRISSPRNRFQLATGANRHLLFGGGIGITPLLSMAFQLSAEARPFELHYFVRSIQSTPMQEALQSSRFASSVN